MTVHAGVALEVLSREECLALLAREPVGRIALTVQALPVVLPVNYAVHHGDVVFRTPTGTKLSVATAGTVVAFEVDHYDPDGHRGWSVLLQGRAHEVVDPTELAQVRTLPLHSWALDGAADHYVRVHTGMVSGRRFRMVAPGTDPADGPGRRAPDGADVAEGGR